MFVNLVFLTSFFLDINHLHEWNKYKYNSLQGSYYRRCVSSVKPDINLPHQTNTSHYCYEKQGETIDTHVT